MTAERRSCTSAPFRRLPENGCSGAARAASSPKPERCPSFSRLREKAFKKYYGTCFACGDSPVDVHHGHYACLGKELPEDLFSLCRTCHTRVHDISKLAHRARGGKNVRPASVFSVTIRYIETVSGLYIHEVRSVLLDRLVEKEWK